MSHLLFSTVHARSLWSSDAIVNWYCTEDQQSTNLTMLYVTGSAAENSVCDCTLSLTSDATEILQIGNLYQSTIGGNLLQQISIRQSDDTHTALYFAHDNNMMETSVPLYIHTGKCTSSFLWSNVIFAPILHMPQFF